MQGVNALDVACFQFFTDSGSGRAIGQVCVCLESVMTVDFSTK